VKRAARAFADALAYFTLLPLPSRRLERPDGYALAFLPLAGGLAGAAAGGFGAFVAWRMPGFGGVAALLATVVLTGAIHVDGFLDCCDALFAAAPPVRRLEILRDPHHGSYAIVAMVLAALVWVRALDRLDPWTLAPALAFVGIVARLAAIAGAYAFPYAREDGFARSLGAHPPLWPIAVATAVALGLGWKLGPATMALLPAAIVAGLLLEFWAARRLGGGITGDVYGAVVVVVEIALLLRLPELAKLLP